MKKGGLRKGVNTAQEEENSTVKQLKI